MISNEFELRACPRVIIAHPIWGRGGAEAAAMWIIASLIHDFKVTVYSISGFNLDELNRLAGTAVSADKVHVQVVDKQWFSFIGTLQLGFFLRSLASIGNEFDLRISASGILPWRQPALHFISSIQWSKKLLGKLEQTEVLPFSLRAFLSQALLDICTRNSTHTVEGDVFVTNSTWTKNQCDSIGITPTCIIHPVIPLLSSGLDWPDREGDVLVFGRISPEKRIEDCIRIVEIARSNGFTGKLVIAGAPGEKVYFDYISTLCREREDWTELLPAQHGEQKVNLLARFRYGLSACRIEAFGIATGEMTVSGMIVFVPEGTGQSDIIQSQEQIYTTKQEAAKQLLDLQRDPELQVALHKVALDTVHKFSPPQFIAKVQQLSQTSLKVNQDESVKS